MFCGDRGKYDFLMPKGYQGHVLQVIISENFLRNYVPNVYLQHPYIHAIISQFDHDPLIIDNVPAYVRAELMKLSDYLGLKKEEGVDKLTLLQLLAEFTNVFFKQYVPHQPRIRSIKQEEVFRTDVRKYLLENVENPFCGVEQLADHFDVSVSTIKRLFKRFLDDTPHHYFAKLQCDYAKALLKSKKYSVSYVAYRLGFSSVSNFIRTYRRVMGETPGEDRKE